MKKENDGPRHKLSEAVEGQIPPEGHQNADRPGRSPHEPDPAEVKQHNAQVNQGLRSNKDRLVDIGRGEQASGRGGS